MTQPSFINRQQEEKAVLISVLKPQDSIELINDYLSELAFLALTAGAKAIKNFQQKLPHPDSRTYVGKGKLDEIALYIKSNDVSVAIFDDELSPSQIRNIEKVLNCKVIDRTHLILDIFAYRARSAQSKVQVELAQYQYLLPRLTRMWTHLEKQRGGIGLRGPGESEIETDRRAIRDKISLLKERLKVIQKQNETQRKQRNQMVRVALVGYTNAGKSTLMNLLAKADVLAENKLFATLDTTVRKVVFNETPFLLSDTVGFIRKLPHQLVESFKSTLDEVRDADILVHVVDISHPVFEEQIQTVQQTLVELKAANKPTIIVFNKADQLKFRAHQADNEEEQGLPQIIEELKQTWMSRINSPCIFISATQKLNIAELKSALEAIVKEQSAKIAY